MYRILLKNGKHKMKEVKCQNPSCKNKVIIEDNAVMYGILCKDCNKQRIWAYEHGRPDDKKFGDKK